MSRNSSSPHNVALLVYNVSHLDFYVALGDKPCDFPCSDPDRLPLARPAFSGVHSVASSVFDTVWSNVVQPQSITLRVPSGSNPTSAPEGLNLSGLDLIHAPLDGTACPIGYKIPQTELRSWHDLRLRAPELQPSPDAAAGPAPKTWGAIFPLLALTMPTWLAHHGVGTGVIDMASSPRAVPADTAANTEFHVILVSGIAQPRNPRHETGANSTEVVAHLMEKFIQRVYPAVQVTRLHSGRGIFRFDDNVHFVRQRLLPSVAHLRSQAVTSWGDQWKQHFTVTLLLSSGAPARVTALSSALRQYTPSYLHFHELKTFWHEGLMRQEDLEAHSFDNVNATPPVRDVDLSATEYAVVEEMRAHYRAFSRIRDGAAGDAGHELASFWLRKSRKPVLAVVAVQQPGDRLRLHRGMNMEVSMPTGSLCAERNAVGVALACTPSLKRAHIKAVAVLSATLVPRAASQPFIEAERLTPGSPGYGSARAASHADATGFNAKCTACTDACEHGTPAVQVGSKRAAAMPLDRTRSISDAWMSGEDSMTGAAETVASHAGSPPLFMGRSMPAVSAELVHKEGLGQGEHGSDVVLNPIAPCGACTEWLRKIAEVNPDFKIMTFADTSCTRVFVKYVE